MQISMRRCMNEDMHDAACDWPRMMQVGTLGCGTYSTVDHCKLALQSPFQQADAGSTDSENGPWNSSAARAAAGRSQAAAGHGTCNGLYGRRYGSGSCHNGITPVSLGTAACDVAVKRLRPTLFDSPTALDDFVREAVLLAGMQHRCAHCAPACMLA